MGFMATHPANGSNNNHKINIRHNLTNLLYSLHLLDIDSTKMNRYLLNISYIGTGFRYIWP